MNTELKRSIVILLLSLGSASAVTLPARHAAAAPTARPAPAASLTQDSFLITVEGPGAQANGTAGGPSGAESEEAKRECAFIHQALLVARGAPVTDACTVSPSARKLAAYRNSGLYRYAVRAIKRPDNSLQLRVENWRRTYESDFEQAVWNIEAATEDTQKLEVQKLLGQVLDYSRNERFTKNLLLTQGLLISEKSGKPSQVRINSETGELEQRADGRKLSFDQAYATFESENPKQRHFLKAAIEILLLLGEEEINYWIGKDTNKVDWDYDFNLDNFRKRFITGEAVTFDANAPAVNFMSHPIAGALYYGFARNNNFTSFESILFAIAGSSLWEYFFEFKESVSINDQVFTPVAGAVIAEVMYQFSDFFGRAEKTKTNRITSWIVGGPAKINQWWNKNLPRTAEKLDGTGYPADVWHQFRWFASVEGNRLGNDRVRPGARVGFDGELINIPIYGRVGSIKKFYTDTAMAKAFFQIGGGEDAFQDFQLLLQAVFAGYYQQSIARGSNGDLKGYSFFVGPGSAYDLRYHDNGKTLDFLAICNVLGPAIELNYYRGGVHLRAKIDVYGDFAGVRSYAIDRYQDVGESLWGLKTELRKSRYYFAFGVTLRSELSASYRRFDVGGAFEFHYFDSIEGRDRFPNHNTNDLNSIDTLTGWKAWLGYTFPGDKVKLALVFQQNRRSGTLGEISDQDIENLLMAQLMYLF